MLDYKLLDALSEVIQQGSFEKAAQSLFITQSAISQRVKLLEQRIGRPLLVRSSPVQATREGQQLLQHARQVRLLESDLMQSLTEPVSADFQTVRLAVNADSLATWLPDIFPELFQHNILIELTVDDQDRTHNYLKTGGVMGCITSLPRPHQGCRSEYIGTMEYITVASPDFFRKYRDLPFSRIPTIDYSPVDDLQNRFLKQHFGLEAGQFPIHKLPSTEAFITAAKAGIAYAIVPRLQARPFLENGDLVEMTPGKNLLLPLYWHYWCLETRLLQITGQMIHKAAAIYLSQKNSSPLNAETNE